MNKYIYNSVGTLIYKAMKRFVFFLFTSASVISIAQNTYYTRGAGGNWSNPNTWSTAGCNGAAASSVPGPLDNVIICNSNGGGAVTVTVDGNYTCNNLTIGNGNNDCYLNVAGTYTLAINGDLKINNTCNNQTYRLNVGNGVVNINGTFSQWCTTNGNNQIWIGQGKIVFNPAVNQTTNNQFIRFYDAGTIVFNNGFSSNQNNNQFQTVTNAQIWFKGNYTQTTNTMDFTMGQTQFPIVYFDCIGCNINNTSRVDFGDVIIYDNAVVGTSGGGNLNITGNLILNANSTFNLSKNVPGNVSFVRSINDIILNSGSTFNIAGGVTYIQSAGNWINNGGTLNASAPTIVRFEGIGNFIGGTSSTTFPHLQFGNTLNNVYYQINQNISCQNLILDADNSARNVVINSYSVQVNGDLIINQPTNNNTNLVSVNGGTLNVSGNLNFSGGTNSNTQVGKLIVNSGLGTINGNITWMGNNTVLSEVIEVNTGTLNLQQDVSAPYNSGVFNITGPGVLNFNGTTAVSLNLNGTGGANPAQLNTVFGSTVTFAKGVSNSNTPLTFANGSYQIFTGNGTITLNATISFGNFVINSGVNVTPTNDFSVQNDWINLGGTFIHNNRRVTFNGTSTQYINKTGGETFYNVTSNSTGAILLNNDVTILNNLTMTNGNWNVNGNLLILGNGGASTLNRTAGIIYGGEFRRYWPAGAAISSTAGNFYGLFPIGTSTEYRPVQINSTAAPTTAGYIGAYHTDAYTATDGSWAANDGMGSTVQRMHDQRTTITNTGVGGGTYNLDVSFTALSSVGTLTDMRLMPYLANGIGTHAAATGAVSSPTVKRTGLTIAQLPNTWAVGTINKDPVAGTPLRQPYYSRKTGNWSDVTAGNATWSTDPVSLVSCDCKPTPGSLVVIKTGHVVTLDIPVTANPNGPIDYLVIENGGSLVGTQDITINYDMEVQGTGNFAPTGGAWLIKRDLNITGSSVSSTSSSATLTVGRHFNMSGNGSLTLNNHLIIGSASGGDFVLNGTINASTNNIQLVASGGSKNISGTGIINGTGTFSITAAGASILAGSSLTIQPNIVISGAITVVNNGTITAINNISGTVLGSTWDNASNSKLIIAGVLLTTGTLKANAVPNIVEYNSGPTILFSKIVKTPTPNTYHTLVISNNDSRRANANLIISGNLIIKDNASFWDNSNSITGTGGLIIQGSTPIFSITSNTNPVPSLNGLYSLTSGIIIFGLNGNQNIRGLNGPVPSAYYHVEFGTNGTKTLQGPILVQKDITISGTNTVLDVKNGFNYKITLGGKWNVTAINNTDHFIERVGEVEFNGTNLQTIDWGANDNTRQFYKLTINNSAPSAAVQILGTNPTSVAANINFIDGHLITNSYTSPNLVIKDNATVTGASDSSHVKGAVVKEGNDAFTFPVGKGIPTAGVAMYAPISISAPSSTTDRFVAEYFFQNPHLAGYDTSLHDLTLNHISGCEYWILDRLSGASSVSVTLSWYSPNATTFDPRSCGVTSLPDLAVARWDGSMWRDHGNGGTTGTTASGTIKSAGLVSSFSPFTLASKTGGGTNPLPIELVDFTGYPRDGYVELYWKTATQINNDYFVLEKSKDGSNWQQLVVVKGAGTSYVPMEYIETDMQPYEGFNYYRLKQVDYDGSYTYSKIIAVEYKRIAKSIEPVLYPNPVERGQSLNIQFGTLVAEALVVLRDMQGREVFSKVIVFEENNTLYAIPIDEKIEPGVYVVIASSNRNVLFSRKVIVK
ncbi:MAG: hypothetical protein KatS3mg027_0463 [Bacteroidia bacterium]|nr:MAG: hypothetical protein KatS3mg027_0463 [Bacteroidia bacterium]